MNNVITEEQFRKLVQYLLDEKRQGTFRYIIYDVMGFKTEDYSWLYSTGLMTLKDHIYELRDMKNKFLLEEGNE